MLHNIAMLSHSYTDGAVIANNLGFRFFSKKLQQTNGGLDQTINPSNQ